MIVSRSRRRGGQALFVLAAAGLLTSVPVRADTPRPTLAIEDVVTLGDEAFDAPMAQSLPAAPEAPEAAPEAAEDSYEPIGEGLASYYGHELAGNRTANGERFNPSGMTAAHRTLPMGSKLRVTNKSNGKSVIVRVNDRGPFVKSRILDVSLGAAKKIAMVRSGTARVRLELLR